MYAFVADECAADSGALTSRHVAYDQQVRINLRCRCNGRIVVNKVTSLFADKDPEIDGTSLVNRISWPSIGRSSTLRQTTLLSTFRKGQGRKATDRASWTYSQRSGKRQTPVVSALSPCSDFARKARTNLGSDA